MNSLSAYRRYEKNPDHFARSYRKHGNKGDMFATVTFLSRAPTQFPPSLAGCLYKKFGATHVLDPFAGWGDRCVAAMAAGCKYTGIDSNKKLEEPYRKMIRVFGGGRRVRMIFRRCQDVDLAKIPFDFVVSSPPFFGPHGSLLEEYEGTERDYSRFMRECLVPMTKKLLRRGVWVCYALPPHMQRRLSREVGRYKKSIKLKSGQRRQLQEHLYFYHK
jgi:hypothetical protein